MPTHHRVLAEAAEESPEAAHQTTTVEDDEAEDDQSDDNRHVAHQSREQRPNQVDHDGRDVTNHIGGRIGHSNPIIEHGPI